MPNSDTLLKRQYGLLTAVAIIIGQVIAVGIFLTPAGMARMLRLNQGRDTEAR